MVHVFFSPFPQKSFLESNKIPIIYPSYCNCLLRAITVSQTRVCSEDQSGSVVKINAYLGNLLKRISLWSLGTNDKSIIAVFWKIFLKLPNPSCAFGI